MVESVGSFAGPAVGGALLAFTEHRDSSSSSTRSASSGRCARGSGSDAHATRNPSRRASRSSASRRRGGDGRDEGDRRRAPPPPPPPASTERRRLLPQPGSVFTVAVALDLLDLEASGVGWLSAASRARWHARRPARAGAGASRPARERFAQRPRPNGPRIAPRRRIPLGADGAGGAAARRRRQLDRRTSAHYPPQRAVRTRCSAARSVRSRACCSARSGSARAARSLPDRCCGPRGWRCSSAARSCPRLWRCRGPRCAGSTRAWERRPRVTGLLAAIPIFAPLPLQTSRSGWRCSLGAHAAACLHAGVRQGDPWGDCFYVDCRGRGRDRGARHGPGPSVGEIAPLTDGAQDRVRHRPRPTLRLLTLERDEFIAAVTGHGPSVGGRAGDDRERLARRIATWCRAGLIQPETSCPTSAPNDLLRRVPLFAELDAQVPSRASPDESRSACSLSGRHGSRPRAKGGRSSLTLENGEAAVSVGVPTSRPPTETAASPFSITKNVRPPSPSVAIVSPDENTRFENSSASRDRCLSSSSAKSGTRRRRSLGADIGRDSMRLDQTGATPGRNAPSRALTIACAAASLGPWPVTAAMNSSRSSVSRPDVGRGGDGRGPWHVVQQRDLAEERPRPVSPPLDLDLALGNDVEAVAGFALSQHQRAGRQSRDAELRRQPLESLERKRREDRDRGEQPGLRPALPRPRRSGAARPTTAPRARAGTRRRRAAPHAGPQRRSGVVRAARRSRASRAAGSRSRRARGRAPRPARPAGAG